MHYYRLLETRTIHKRSFKSVRLAVCMLKIVLILIRIILIGHMSIYMKYVAYTQCKRAYQSCINYSTLSLLARLLLLEYYEA